MCVCVCVCVAKHIVKRVEWTCAALTQRSSGTRDEVILVLVPSQLACVESFRQEFNVVCLSLHGTT